MQEGWNKCTSKSVRYIDTKKGPKFIFEWINESGETVSDWIAEEPDYYAGIRLKQLVEIADISWDEGTSGDEVARLFNDSLLNADVEVEWGNGDNAFVKSYAPSNTTTVASKPEPRPASSAPVNRRRF